MPTEHDSGFGRQTAQVSPKWFFQAVDAMGLLIAFGAAFFFLRDWGLYLNPNFVLTAENNSAALLLLTLPLWLFLLDWGGMYADPVRVSYLQIVWGMVKTIFIGLGLVTLLVFVIKEQGVSRLFVFSYGGFAFLVLTSLRAVEKVYYGMRHEAGYYARRPLVVGSPQGIRTLQELLRSTDYSADFRINAWPVSETELKPGGGVEYFTLKLRQWLAKQSLSEVVLLVNAKTECLLEPAMRICSELGQPVRLISDAALRYQANTPPDLSAYADLFLGIPSLLVVRTRTRPEYEFAKRLLDLAVSSVLLVGLAPVFAVVAMLVKLSSPGPIFYRWRVLGQNNKEFTGFKFRTMVANADQLKAGLMQYNEMTGPAFKMKNDPRVTPLGRFLRRYSLDELPQLFSVLKGDMSLVGPRPPLQSEFKRFEFWQARKLSVKPGITCLWQISGRNEIKDFDEWVRLDLEYIDRRSLTLDFEILAMTALAVLRGTGR